MVLKAFTSQIQKMGVDRLCEPHGLLCLEEEEQILNLALEVVSPYLGLAILMCLVVIRIYPQQFDVSPDVSVSTQSFLFQSM